MSEEKRECAIAVNDVTKIYRLYDKPIDRLKESLSLTHKSYHKDFFALNTISFTVEKGQTVAKPAEGLSVALHASIGGKVEEVTEKYVIISG